MRERLRLLMVRLLGKTPDPAGRRETTAPTVSPFDRPADVPPSNPGPLDAALDEVEVGALEVYARAGLPTTPGHYRRSPGTADWTFVAARLSPEDRFALTLDHPPEAGWRFARLQDLGARSDRAELKAASRLLNDIADLRAARHGILTQDHLLLAMELGGAWRALRDSKAVAASRLTLTLPKAPTKPKKPRAKGDKTARPR